jgi:hypothetical protein
MLIHCNFICTLSCISFLRQNICNTDLGFPAQLTTYRRGRLLFLLRIVLLIIIIIIIIIILSVFVVMRI